MATDWRIQLQEKIHEIKEQGGPRPQGETIFVQTPLTESEVEQFAGVTGQVNDLPFGEAPAGTLEIRPPARWEDGTAQLVFIFRPNSPEHFGSSMGLMQARGPQGEYPIVRLGIDFNELPGLIFPIERGQLEMIKKGLRHNAVVPVPRGVSVASGKRVIFVEAMADPFGTPFIAPGAESLSVTLINTIDQNYSWAGRSVHRIDWDPKEVLGRATGKSPNDMRNQASAEEG